MTQHIPVQNESIKSPVGPVPTGVYFDHNGSTPCPTPVIDEMSKFLTHGYGNPTSGHWASDPARAVIEAARCKVAELIGAQPAEIILTSGATEANNLAIKGVWQKNKTAHFITSAVEHDAVLRVFRFLKTQGASVSVVPVDRFGVVDPDRVARAIRPETIMISIMHANNETGTIQPISDVGEIAQNAGVLIHSDAAQSVGKIPVDVDRLRADMLSIAGHKFGAPNGIGALFLRPGVNITPLIHGAKQEHGLRAGTESALLAAGLGKAAELAASKDNSLIRGLRDYFWNALSAAFQDRVVLNGHPTRRVPNTLNISFPGRRGADILAQMPYLAATTGSACHAGCIEMSHVLIASNVPHEVGVGAIRFSLGDTNTIEEIDRVVADLIRVVG